MKDMLSLFKIKLKKSAKNADNDFSEIHTRYIYAHKSVKNIKFGIIRGILSLLETK